MATLTASHYLYLDRSQRYDINSGKDVVCDGVYVPVWFHDGKTSEPAKEVFCSYTLRNSRKRTGIEPKDSGFTIDLPYFEVVGDGPTDPEVVRAAQQRIGTSECLLDLDDGGFECCEFRFYYKKKLDKLEHNIVHFVEIKPVEMLIDTLN